jgi:hypothetical protein
MSEQHDLCAHGAVEVQIGRETIENDEEADWCVSAGALFLMRTVTRDHTSSSPVGDQLIPCCGHTIYVIVGEEDVEIQNCNTGINWEVRHVDNTILLRTSSGTEEYLTADEWKHVVFQFADAVEGLYSRSLPKEPENAYEAKAFAAFQVEWSRHRGRQFLHRSG